MEVRGCREEQLGVCRANHGIVEGKDERHIEVGRHLNETSANSEVGEGEFLAKRVRDGDLCHVAKP